MNFEYIQYEVTEKIAWLTFNRPDQLNAMNRRMMEEIITALGMINTADPDTVRIGIITGAGKAFMAGADIKEYARQTREQFEDFQSRGRSIYAAIEGNAKPILAAMNGYAFGGGLEIALACDMILAAEGAKMGLPEIHLNLIPGGGGTQRLPKKIGVNLANEMIMTGKTVAAEEMHRHGLINHIYPQEGFLNQVKAFAAQLTDKEPDRLLAIKQLIQISTGGVEMGAQGYENAALSTFYRSDKGQEKIQEFYRKSQEKKP